jgi:signal peptidase II
MTANYRKFYLSLLMVIMIDQLTKLLFFSPEMSVNQGISFSLISDVPQWLLVLGLWMILLMVWQWGRELWLQNQVAAGFFFGGAISNLIDRVVYGGVRDFLPVPILGVENNIADYFLTMSVIWLGLMEIKKYRAHQDE